MKSFSAIMSVWLRMDKVLSNFEVKMYNVTFTEKWDLKFDCRKFMFSATWKVFLPICYFALHCWPSWKFYLAILKGSRCYRNDLNLDLYLYVYRHRTMMTLLVNVIRLKKRKVITSRLQSSLQMLTDVFFFHFTILDAARDFGSWSCVSHDLTTNNCFAHVQIQAAIWWRVKKTLLKVLFVITW